MKSGVSVTRDEVRSLRRALAALGNFAVMVGVPSDSEQPHEGAGVGTDARSGTAMDNATLAYIHEVGSPAANIPARPFLVPGVASAQAAIQGRLRDAGEAALGGDLPRVMKNLHAAGLTAQSAVRNRIRSKIPPPLAASTIARRRRRTSGGKYKRKAVVAADVTPLIDTGQLLNSISYVIRRK